MLTRYKKTGELWIAKHFIPFDDDALCRAMDALGLEHTDDNGSESDYVGEEELEGQNDGQQDWLAQFKKDRRDAAKAEGRTLYDEDEDEDYEGTNDDEMPDFLAGGNEDSDEDQL